MPPSRAAADRRAAKRAIPARSATPAAPMRGRSVGGRVLRTKAPRSEPTMRRLPRRRSRSGRTPAAGGTGPSRDRQARTRERERDGFGARARGRGGTGRAPRDAPPRRAQAVDAELAVRLAERKERHARRDRVHVLFERGLGIVADRRLGRPARDRGVRRDHDLARERHQAAAARHRGDLDRALRPAHCVAVAAVAVVAAREPVEACHRVERAATAAGRGRREVRRGVQRRVAQSRRREARG